jgi:hypothetical protein
VEQAFTGTAAGPHQRGHALRQRQDGAGPRDAAGKPSGWLSTACRTSRRSATTPSATPTPAPGVDPKINPTRITYGDMTVPPGHPDGLPGPARGRADGPPGGHRPHALAGGQSDAINTSWTLNQLVKDMPYGDAAIPDPNFKWDPAAFKQVTKAIPEEFWPTLASAHSQQHADFLLGRVEDKLATQDRLHQLGWTGTAMQIAAEFTDLPSLAIAAATDGAAASIMIPQKAARLGNVIGRAASGAAAGVAVEGYHDAGTSSPRRTPTTSGEPA